MEKNWKTKLIHPDASAPQGFKSLITPVYRGSTVVFSKAEDLNDQWNQYEAGYTYGVYGTQTAFELAARVCELEGGVRTILAPGGQAAISLVNLSLLKSGDHILVSESIYGPNRKLASHVMRRLGIEVTYYPPVIGSEIESLFKPNTALVWCESPGSVTMEVQDIPTIAQVAHKAGALVVVDNTWSAGIFFDAFAHGADVSVQALTKYIGGHSDLLLGSVTVRREEIYNELGSTQQLLGCAVSPDDCSLALRGLKTLAVRLKAIEESALFIAQWISRRPEIDLVLHPALPSCPGYDFWQRDFTGSAGVFSIVFRRQFTKEKVLAFVNALQLFKIGYSWGGVNSLVVAYDLQKVPRRPDYGARIVRLNIGLEDVGDLIADLEQALAKLN